MDLTQLIITALAVLGIVVMGAMAVVPTVLELRDGTDADSRTPAPLPVWAKRDDHDLAA